MSKDVAVFAKGTKLERGDGASPEVFSEIKGITSWGVDPGGAGEPEKLDVTSGSTVGLVREKIDGYSDLRSGSLDLDMEVDLANTVHAAMANDSISGANVNYKLTVPTTAGTKTATFTARVSGFPLSIPFDKIVAIKAKLSVVEGTWLWA